MKVLGDCIDHQDQLGEPTTAVGGRASNQLELKQFIKLCKEKLMRYKTKTKDGA